MECSQEPNHSTINLLLISDIHRKETLKRLIKRKEEILGTTSFDYILNCGDLTFVDHFYGQKSDDLKYQIWLFHHVLSSLESFEIPHIYIPGNHDPIETYSCSVPSVLAKITELSTNLHNHCVKLADHLWLAGFGGSTPKLTEDGSLFGPGFPFKFEDMKQEITELISLIPKHDQVILMTHSPPAHVGSCTIDQDGRAGMVFSLGSQSMYDQITSLMQDYDLFLVIHGHTHPEPGMNWIHRYGKNCCVVNPGGNGRGLYGKLRLQLINGSWKIVSCEH